MTSARLGVIFVYLLLASGCSQPPPHLPPPSDDTYRIYSSFPTTGPASARSLEIVRAIDLALAQSDDGQEGHRLEHIKLGVPDTESGDSARAEALNADFATSDPSAVAYLGPYTSSAAAISLPISNREGLLQIGVSPTWPGLTQHGWESSEAGRHDPSGQPTYVRLSRSDNIQAQAAAKWAASEGAERIVTVSDGSTYSNGMRTSFERAMQSEGISLAGSLQLSDENLSDVRNELVKLTADAVFYAPSTTRQAVDFARAIEHVNLKAGIFSTDTALNDQFVGETLDAARAWHIVFNGAVGLPATDESADFSRAFTAAYGSKPGILAAYAFDATMIIIRAVNTRPGVDRALVAQEVIRTTKYHGASGPVSFDTNGDIIGWTIPGYQVKGGSFMQVRTLVSSP